jgi:PAS domain S-box-containing protein
MADRDEDDELRSVALQNAQSILVARRRAEEELLRTRDALEQASRELLDQGERFRVTLSSIGDGVITTDVDGRVTSLNSVAQQLTGWTEPDAQGLPLDQVFRILSEESRVPVENPASRALREERTVGLANHTVLIARDGTETPIDDSASPIRDREGKILGVVLVFRDVTGRREAEHALRRGERELADLFEHAAIGMHLADPEGILLRVNQAQLDLLGYSRQEYLSRNIAEFHVDPEVIRDILTRLEAGEDIREREARMRRRDGSIVHVLIDANVLREGDRFIQSRWFLRDLSAIRRVAETQSRLAAIVESSHDAIISKTLTGRIVSWNPEATRLFGYEASEAIGQPITMLIPPERLSEETTILSRLQRGERIEEFETIRVGKSGERLEVSLSVSPVLDVHGRVVGASKIVRDISARRRAELAARHAQETTRFLADATAALSELSDFEAALRRVATLAVPAFADWCAFDVQDPDGTIRRLAVQHSDAARLDLANELFRRYPPAPADSHGVTRTLSTGKSEWMPSLPDALLEGGARDPEHLAMMRRLGLKSYICTPIRTPSVRAVLSFATAESGRVYSATDLAVAEDLAHRAAIAIENASLLQALQDADRRKDEFLAILAHELRNPLAPIRNAVHIMRVKGPPVPELQWAREVIERQVLQMTRLVDDLLDVSRITKGKIELRRERVDLASLVHSAVEASRPLIRKWSHQLSVAIPAEPVQLDVDPTRLAQVLLNLLNNAAKYTEENGHIELRAEVQGGDVVIRVTDDGVGIPAEMLPRIFDMFTQVDRSLERSQGGLGIGLTLVQQLVEMHGGTVQARSEGAGRGSEFVVRLPLAVDGQGMVNPGRDLPAGLALNPPLRVLVVDDNQDAAESLAVLLRHAGCEVRTAHDGVQAVGAASVFKPEAAILDLGLPGLNGFDAGRRIRQELGRGVTLIAVTGWGQDEDRRRSSAAGFDYHLTKPVELEGLQRLLSRVRSAPR